jgi:hypothetical protein
LKSIKQFALDPALRFRWLCGDPDAVMRGEEHCRLTILAELGRIDDEQEREEMALYLCEVKPTTREAVALIRQVRTQRVPPGDTTQLADLIRHAINTYLREHATMPWNDVRQALFRVLADIDATEENETDARTTKAL